MSSPLWSNIFGIPREKRALIEVLATLPAFEGLSTNEVAQVERGIHERRFKAGETVFDEGMPGAGMYIVREGEVVIRKMIGESHEVDLAVVREKSFFGEMALIDEMPRSASAIARTEAILYAFCKPDLENLLERNPHLAAKILNNVARMVCKRLVKTNDLVESLKQQLVTAGIQPDESSN
jgi:CRP-like cAMP-binding protein